jgi:hypothetical protein
VVRRRVAQVQNGGQKQVYSYQLESVTIFFRSYIHTYQRGVGEKTKTKKKQTKIDDDGFSHD